MKKIKTTTKVKQHSDGLFYFVARQILRFTQNDKKNNFSVVYQEYIFDLVDFNDKDIDGNDIVTKQEVLIAKYPEYSQVFSKEEINFFFGQSENGINNVEEFNDLQVKAMIYDTINQGENGRYNTKEWIKYV